MEIQPCNGGAWQKWVFKSDPARQFILAQPNHLVHPQADRCVGVKARKTADGTRLQLWTCSGQDDQKWTAR